MGHKAPSLVESVRAPDHHLGAGARWLALSSSAAAEPFSAGFGLVAIDHADTWVLRPGT